MDTSEAQRKAIEMYLAGEKTATIEASTGVKRNKLYWALQKEGIPPSRIRNPSRDENNRDCPNCARLEAELSRERAISDNLRELVNELTARIPKASSRS